MTKTKFNQIKSSATATKIQKVAGKQQIVAGKQQKQQKQQKVDKKTVRPVGPPNDFVYLIQEREFIKMREPIYKLGKTTQEPNARLRGYPNQSRVILYIDVSAAGCHSVERELMSEFDRLYIHRADIGREYYEGDLEKMKTTFFRVVTTAQEAALRQSFLQRVYSSIVRFITWRPF